MFRKIVGTVRYEIPPTNKHADPTPLNNHHQMISAYKGRQNLYEYCIGGKTGWTSDAGNTLVTFAEKDGMTLICVVMNCTAGGQYADTRTLFDYCFENFKLYNVAQNETRYENTNKQENTLFTEWNAFAKVEDDAQIILPAAANFLDTQTDVNYDQAGGKYPRNAGVFLWWPPGGNCECGDDRSKSGGVPVWRKIRNHSEIRQCEGK